MNISLKKTLKIFEKTSMLMLMQGRSSYYIGSRFFAHASDSNKPKDPTSRESMMEHNWLIYDPDHQKSQRTHKSVAERNIHRIPVVEVDQDVVRCFGGTKIGAGHPQVYIQLNTKDPSKPQTCKWCGLKFVRKHHGHGDQEVKDHAFTHDHNN